MISKNFKGRDFGRLLHYLLSKPDAQLLTTNTGEQTIAGITQALTISQRINPRVQRPVYHAPLSLPPSERLDAATWCELGQSFLQAMGFTDNLYAIMHHGDRAHDHVHLVASRIGWQGQCVSDRFDYHRAQQVVRALEQQYGLWALSCSWQRR